MKKSVYVFVLLTILLATSVCAEGFIFPRETETFLVEKFAIIIEIGKERIKYSFPVKGGIVESGKRTALIFLENGKKCQHFFRVSLETLEALREYVNFETRAVDLPESCINNY